MLLIALPDVASKDALGVPVFFFYCGSTRRTRILKGRISLIKRIEILCFSSYEIELSTLTNFYNIFLKGCSHSLAKMNTGTRNLDVKVAL